MFIKNFSLVQCQSWTRLEFLRHNYERRYKPWPPWFCFRFFLTSLYNQSSSKLKYIYPSSTWVSENRSMHFSLKKQQPAVLYYFDVLRSMWNYTRLYNLSCTIKRWERTFLNKQQTLACSKVKSRLSWDWSKSHFTVSRFHQYFNSASIEIRSVWFPIVSQ